jgi:hypothetical protein
VAARFAKEFVGILFDGYGYLVEGVGLIGEDVVLPIKGEDAGVGEVWEGTCTAAAVVET